MKTTIEGVSVKSLIKELQKLNPEDLVIMSRDSEGNGFTPLYSITLDRYDPYYDELGIRELTKEHINNGYSEEDVMIEGIDCVTLWPR